MEISGNRGSWIQAHVPTCTAAGLESDHDRLNVSSRHNECMRLLRARTSACVAGLALGSADSRLLQKLLGKRDWSGASFTMFPDHAIINAVRDSASILLLTFASHRLGHCKALRIGIHGALN